MTDRDFGKLESEGWANRSKVGNYVASFARATDIAIAPIISASGAGPGTRILDLCCGHGAGTAALLAAITKVTGLDFSPAMLLQPKGVPLPLGPSTITWVRGSENVAWAIFLGSATGTAAPNRSSARWTLDLHVQNAALHSVLSRMTIKCPVFCQRLIPFALQYSNILGFHAHPPTHTLLPTKLSVYYTRHKSRHKSTSAS